MSALVAEALPAAAPRPLRIPTADGVILGATLYPSQDPDSGRCVVIAGGVGVTQERFAPYADFMTAQGWSVVTFDYRGIGASIQGAQVPRRLLTMQAWGDQDIAAVIDWISSELAPTRLVAVAHSIGGQILPFAANADRVAAMMTVGAQRGAWRHWDGFLRRLGNWAFFRVYVPLSVGLTGQLQLGFVDLPPLPAKAAIDWARWGVNDEYLCSDGTPMRPCIAEFRSPVLALSIADDHLFAPQRAVDDLFDSYYVNAPVLRCHIEPSRQGLTECGHFGFFDPAICPEAWWRETSDWLAGVPQAARPERLRDGFGPGTTLLDASVVRLSGRAVPSLATGGAR